tara:strand:+ start:456 stop:662 length:207 start_codon:yes stop_codon:yes gene_type:complete
MKNEFFILFSHTNQNYFSLNNLLGNKKVKEIVFALLVNKLKYLYQIEDKQLNVQELKQDIILQKILQI